MGSVGCGRGQANKHLRGKTLAESVRNAGRVSESSLQNARCSIRRSWISAFEDAFFCIQSYSKSGATRRRGNYIKIMWNSGDLRCGENPPQPRRGDRNRVGGIGLCKLLGRGDVQ